MKALRLEASQSTRSAASEMTGASGVVKKQTKPNPERGRHLNTSHLVMPEISTQKIN